MASSEYGKKLVFVHHRKTGGIEICRTDVLSRRLEPPTFPIQQRLHCTAKSCSNSKGHEDFSHVASNLTQLTAQTTRVFDKHLLGTSLMAGTCACAKQHKAESGGKGVCTEYLHYATKRKDVVCRCTKPNNHRDGAVRNPNIPEFCADCFRLNKGKTTCTKAQWCAAGASLSSNPPDRKPSDYDSRSKQNLFRKRKVKEHSKSQPKPKPDITQVRDRTNGNLGIPVQVWENARPSVWKSHQWSETPSSTLLGTASTPRFPVASSAQTIHSPRSLPLKLSERASVPTIWSTVQQDAARGVPQISSKVLQTPQTAPHVNGLVGAPTKDTSFSDHITDSKGRTGKLSYDLWHCGIQVAQDMQANHLPGTPSMCDIVQRTIVPHKPEILELPGAPLVGCFDRKSITELHGCAIPSELHHERFSPV